MNRNYAYSTTSIGHIKSTEPVVQELCNRAIKIANERKLYCPDFGISSGHRTTAEQYSLFCIGRFGDENPTVTNCDGTDKMSSHQSGLAIDFFAINSVTGREDYRPESLALVATCFFEAASDMGIDADWGGSYRSFSDAPHIEVRV